MNHCSAKVASIAPLIFIKSNSTPLPIVIAIAIDLFDQLQQKPVSTNRPFSPENPQNATTIMKTHFRTPNALVEIQQSYQAQRPTNDQLASTQDEMRQILDHLLVR